MNSWICSCVEEKKNPELTPDTCKPDGPVDPQTVLLPAGAALTLADLQGAILLQRVLALQTLQTGVGAEGRHGLLGRTVFQKSKENHAGVLLEAALLRHQAV